MIKEFAFTVIVIMTISCGRDEPIANYEPGSPDEKALKRVLLDFQDGVNSRDAEKVAGVIHDQATLIIGRQREQLSKTQYLGRLPQRLSANFPIALSIPRVSIQENSADVRVYLSRGDFRLLMTFQVLLENGKWFINSWSY